MSLAVASHYARALVELVAGPGAPVSGELAVAQLRAFEGLVNESAALRNVLLSPAVSAARKRSAVAKLGEQLGIAPLMRNFLFVIIDHRRVNLLRQIREALETLLDERMGMVRAEITSAHPLPETQRASVEASLARLTGKRIRGQYSVDDSLIGGLTAKIGSRIYDGSVQGQLSGLRRRLASE